MSDTIVIQSHRGPYTVDFDEDVFSRLSTATGTTVHYLVDRQVAELYRADLAPVLGAPSVLLIDANENSKSLERFPAYVAHLVSRSVRRDHELIAVGGGVIQDITSFLAATLLRGISWRFFPTTLLAQADSCIGSKSSVNCGDAKNILGTFTPPHEITVATRFLDTLGPAEIRSGVGEMLKAHAIEGPDAFDLIARDYSRLFADRGTLVRYLRRSLEIKRPYVEKDEFDRGPRLIFNYGHSFGHALEAATEFAIPHGIAVTMGMDMANYVAARKRVGDPELYRSRHPILKANFAGYETLPVPLAAFHAAMAKDKKNVGRDRVTVVLPTVDRLLFRTTIDVDDEFRGICRDYLMTERGT